MAARRRTFAGLALAALSALARPAAADDCGAMADAVMAKTSATVEGRSPSGLRVFLKHPSVADLTVSCDVPAAGVSGSWDGADPPALFFKTLATAGSAAIDERADSIRGAMRDCRKKALASKSKLAEIDRGRLHLECRPTGAMAAA